MVNAPGVGQTIQSNFATGIEPVLAAWEATVVMQMPVLLIEDEAKMVAVPYLESTGIT